MLLDSLKTIDDNNIDEDFCLLVEMTIATSQKHFGGMFKFGLNFDPAKSFSNVA